MNKKWVLRIGFIVIVFVAVLAKPIYNIINAQENSSNTSLFQYNNLFTTVAQSKLKIISTVTSANREPESDYVYDEKFDVFVYRMTIYENLDFRNIINVQNGISSMSNEEVYSRLPSYNLKMNKESGPIPKVKMVNLEISGSHLNIIQTDNISSYYFEFNHFSIGYNNGSYDIVAETDSPNVPVNILFMKKANFLYVILMTIKTEKGVMLPTQLYDIINK